MYLEEEGNRHDGYGRTALFGQNEHVRGSFRWRDVGFGKAVVFDRVCEVSVSRQGPRSVVSVQHDDCLR